MTSEVGPASEAWARLWWAVPAATVLALAGLAMLLAKNETLPKPGNSYDASDQGFRASYLLLEELGYPVARSKRPAGGAGRFVLFPTTGEKQAGLLDAWVREGGIALLAVDRPDFARQLGVNVDVHEREDRPLEGRAAGMGVRRLAAGLQSVDWPVHEGKVLAEVGGQPAVTAHPHGRGQIWLVNRPELLTNEYLKEADNAVLLCRLADEMLADRPGKIEFDEFCHGMRDRPDVTELLLRPPALWVTLQALLLLGLVLWHFAPRFGTLRPVPALRRRSKEEFLDAMSSLLERKHAYADAYETVRAELLRAVEGELGLPPGAPADHVVAEAGRRRAVRAESLAPLWAAPPDRMTPPSFLLALNDLETTRDEFFRRHHR